MRAFGSRKNAARACSTSPLTPTPAEPPLVTLVACNYMGRAKHRPGRAGTWLEVKVRNGQRYLYERTRVYDGGKSHITSTYLYKLPPEKPEPVEQPQATAQKP